MCKPVTEAQKRFEALYQADRDAENIRCPVCGYVWDITPYITCWGEDGPQDDECPECGTVLTIKECVTRTFEVTVADAEDSG